MYFFVFRELFGTCWDTRYDVGSKSVFFDFKKINNVLFTLQTSVIELLLKEILTFQFLQAFQILYEHLEVFVPPHVDVQIVEFHLKKIN